MLNANNAIMRNDHNPDFKLREMTAHQVRRMSGVEIQAGPTNASLPPDIGP